MQDGEIGISVFPKRKEILVGSLCLGLVSRESARSGELQARQCTPGKGPYPPSVINELLKFGRCRIPVVEDEIGFSAQVDWLTQGHLSTSITNTSPSSGGITR
jgi:hypothetical protein